MSETVVYIHKPGYEYKGFTCDAYARVTSMNSTLQDDGLYSVTTSVNKWTSSSCEYDIEQTMEQFKDITPVQLDANYLTSILPERDSFSGWVIA